MSGLDIVGLIMVLCLAGTFFFVIGRAYGPSKNTPLPEEERFRAPPPPEKKKVNVGKINATIFFKDESSVPIVEIVGGSHPRIHTAKEHLAELLNDWTRTGMVEIMNSKDKNDRCFTLRPFSDIREIKGEETDHWIEVR